MRDVASRRIRKLAFVSKKILKRNKKKQQILTRIPEQKAKIQQPTPGLTFFKANENQGPPLSPQTTCSRDNRISFETSRRPSLTRGSLGVPALARPTPHFAQVGPSVDTDLGAAAQRAREPGRRLPVSWREQKCQWQLNRRCVNAVDLERPRSQVRPSLMAVTLQQRFDSGSRRFGKPGPNRDASCRGALGGADQRPAARAEMTKCDEMDHFVSSLKYAPMYFVGKYAAGNVFLVRKYAALARSVLEPDRGSGNRAAEWARFAACSEQQLWGWAPEPPQQLLLGLAAQCRTQARKPLSLQARVRFVACWRCGTREATEMLAVCVPRPGPPGQGASPKSRAVLAGRSHGTSRPAGAPRPFGRVVERKGKGKEDDS